ncbi:MAG: hypothetical protein ACK55Z_36315 [bacterium]
MLHQHQKLPLLFRVTILKLHHWLHQQFNYLLVLYLLHPHHLSPLLKLLK